MERQWSVIGNQLRKVTSSGIAAGEDGQGDEETKRRAELARLRVEEGKITF